MLTCGRAAFVQPLLAAGLTSHLFDALATEPAPAPKLVTATLQALRSLAASASGTFRAVGRQEQVDRALPVDVFQRILTQQNSNTAVGRQQLKYAYNLPQLSTPKTG